MPAKRFRSRLIYPSLFFIILALVGRAAIPVFPGFWIIPGISGLLLLLVYAPGQAQEDIKKLASPRGKRIIWAVVKLHLIMAALLWTGSLWRLPIINLGAPPEATLGPDSLRLLDKLDSPVKITAYISPDNPASQGPAEHLLRLYAKASDKIEIEIRDTPAIGQAAEMNLTLFSQDSLEIESLGFSENVVPISKEAIEASLQRIILPNRIVYNLIGDGEKSVLDRSPQGLSALSDALGRQKVYMQDYHWVEGNPLPLEASALLLAGPRAPLGGAKEQAIMAFLAQGGKMAIMADPLTSAFEPGFFSIFGLDMPDGLLVNPEYSLAGSNDLFSVSVTFPAHPSTIGLYQPVLWPLAGAIGTASGNFSETPAEDDLLAGHTWALAQSSDSSWLETDRQSLNERNPHFQADEDPSGPLALATATSLAGGGRLVLLADSDLAANAFLDYSGNLNFVRHSLFWLMGGEEDLPQERRGLGFQVTNDKARFLFWWSVIVWPGLAVFVWFMYFRRIRNKMA